MYKYFWYFVLVAALILAVAPSAAPSQQFEEKPNYKPVKGYVPDEETACRIAEAVWIPIYGKGDIQREKPFVATLSNGIWHVSGSMPGGQRKRMHGGVAIIEISKDDGRILRVTHGK